MYRCEDCQRDFKTAQALAGHHQFKHGRAAGAAGEQGGQQLTKAQLQQLVAAQASNAQLLEDMLVNRFQQLDEKLSMLGSMVDGLLSVPGEHAEHGHGEHAHDPATCDGCRDLVDQNQENPDDGQPVAHEHGDNCDLCVHEQMKGVQRSAVWHDKNVPGAKEAREHAMTGEKMVTIVQ